MTVDLAMTERRFKNSTRMLQQSMWLLLVIAVSLLLVVRRAGSAHAAPLWILGCAILAFLLSFALRDALQMAGQRNTEDKIVKDVRTFLERQRELPVVRFVPAAPAISRPATGEDDQVEPRMATCFMSLKRSAAFGTAGAKLAVCDAIPSRRPVSVRMDFYPVLLPMVSN